MPASLVMIVVEIIYIVLLVVIVGVIMGRGEDRERIGKRVLEGTIIIQLLIIGQWGIMGEEVSSIEGYR